MLDSYSFRRGYAVTPNDGVALAEIPRRLYIGKGGDVTVLLVDDTVPILFKAVPTGAILPIRPIRVMDTGTDAENIIALY